MIWEVDENIDQMIDFDELQLTYYRNITDTTGTEPCLFFKVLEVRFILSLVVMLTHIIDSSLAFFPSLFTGCFCFSLCLP